AETYAARAARRFGEVHRLASRAYRVAGMGAHFRGDAKRAVEHQEVAQKLAQTEDDRLEAIWGSFVAHYMTDRADLEPLLDEYSRHASGSIDSELRVLTGRLICGLFKGQINRAIDQVEPAIALLARSRN